MENICYSFPEILIVICVLYFHTVSILPEKTTFNVDNVRVCKILVSIILITVSVVSSCPF